MLKLPDKLNKYINRYLSTKVVFVLDMLMSLAASFVTLLLVNIITTKSLLALNVSVVWMLACLLYSFIFIWVFRTYRIIIRHMTIREMGRFTLVAFCKIMMMGFTFGIIHNFSRVLYVMMLGDFFFTIAAFFFLRVVMLVVYDLVKSNLSSRNKTQNVLIYGIGDRSVSLINRLHTSDHYNIVGFIQYGSHEISHVISEKTVFYIGDESHFRRCVDAVDAEAIIFTSDEDVRLEQDRVMKMAIAHGLKTLLTPSIDEIVGGKIQYRLRDIQIEDLLMRPEINISMDEIMTNFRGKTVMVTGAAGSIGSELCRQLATFGVKTMVLYDNAETPMHNLRLELEEKYPELEFAPIIGDVRLERRLDYAFRQWRPQVVFHAAAYKHVPLMEENPCEAVLVNVAGSRNVADKCVEYGVEMMVMVSTDKAVNPTNIMGCTKRLAEIYVQSLGLALEQGYIDGKTKFVTTRFGNVLGSNGSVIPRFRDQIAKGGPVTVTHPEITRFFMTIPEACRLVLEAATMSTGNQIFVFDMGESVKIDTLARRMIRLAGFVPDEDIKIEYTGLRPGEKLYEEVLANNENTLPTSHSRIRIAKVREYDYSNAQTVSNELERLSREVAVDSMVALMKTTVPEFISKNSRFEKFDKGR